MRIRNQEFGEEPVDIDGNVFEGCTFTKSRMTFRATGPVTFSHCVFNDVSWQFNDAASLTTAFMRLLSDETGDYGKSLLVNTFPALKEWLRPEILAKLPPAKGDQHG